MPSGDRTGPEGFGPRTGRGFGYCNGYDTPGYTKGMPRGGRGYARGAGRGLGRGFGLGRRRGFYPYPAEQYMPNGIHPTMNKEDEKNYLKEIIETLENELRTIKDRLQELEKKNDKETP